MYIREVHIENIRSISKFDMKFREGEEAGWHVLIGDNGSGKTTILRSIALGLIGQNQAQALRTNWSEWLPGLDKGERSKIELFIASNLRNEDEEFRIKLYIEPIGHSIYLLEPEQKGGDKTAFNEKRQEWFSTGFGPFRRFKGGASEWEQLEKNPSFRRLGAHISLFEEDCAFTEITEWLKNWKFKELEYGKSFGPRPKLKYLFSLINSDDFLPNKTRISEVNSDGVFFSDISGNTISLFQLSDGYRSILSLTLELIRQLVNNYGWDTVFREIQKGGDKNMYISLSGIVLIDEIDAHLHPTWQTRIGQWFTKYFPNLQFIVTTHSPLVCRACEKGTIWRLAAPGSKQESGEITGVDRDKLIYGNVLDAYGTEVFGKDVSISQDANDKLNRLGELNIKSIMGEPMSPEEEAEYYELKSIFPTQQTK